MSDFECIELNEAAAELRKVPGLTIEGQHDTRRGWYFEYNVTHKLFTFFGYTILWYSSYRNLSLAIWPGGAASIASALTGGAIPPGTAADTLVNYKISSRPNKGKKGAPQHLHLVHTFAEALKLVAK